MFKMYYKKKKKYYKNLNNKNNNSNCNFIIDSKGRKKFWLNRRVSRKEFKFLKFKFKINCKNIVN